MKYAEIPILMYHDISHHDAEWIVSPENFRQQMEFLKKVGYKTITLDQLQENLGKETEEKFVVLTFDDARNGVYEHAFPILQKLGFKATIFVVPNWIENPQTIPKQEKYSSFCNWEQLKIMSETFQIGSHTFSHPNLTNLDKQNLILELDQAEKLLAKNADCLVNHFCYPYGKYSSEVLKTIKQRYSTAVTIKKGFHKSAGEFSRQWVVKKTSLEQFENLLRKPTLSLCMIVKNEEAYLEQCLSSIQTLVDEIIIVDTGSTDKTKEIAAKFTDKIYDFTWNDDFSAARNESIKHAKSDWILILDADELIAENDFPALQEVLHNQEISGYKIITKNYSNDSSIIGWKPLPELNKLAQGWYPSLKVRLFRRQKEHFFTGRIHEMVDQKISGTISILKIPVHHYGTLANNSDDKTKKHLQMSKKKLDDHPEDAKTYYELGIQYKDVGKFSEAEESFKKSLQLDAQPLSPRLNLALVQQKQGKIEEAVKTYQQILTGKTTKNILAEVHFGLGFCHFKKNNLKEALHNFLFTIKYNSDHLDASINAGALYEKMGKLDQAIILLKNALAIHPQNARAYYNLGIVYEKQKDLNSAKACYEKAVEFNYFRKNELLKKISNLTS